jgi:hypothetical protein
MMEIQTFHSRQRPSSDFERSFPLLSSLGVLKLFTIYDTRPGVSSSDIVRVPVGIDPALTQILASLRFDILMAQHDRTHTQVCERDELYRFAWCLDAVRREKNVEERHFDEMEDIFTRVQAQLTPLLKAASKKADKTGASSSSSGATTRAKKGGASKTENPSAEAPKTVMAASSTKLVIGKALKGSTTTTTVVSAVETDKKPAKRTSRRTVGEEPEEPETPSSAAPMTRKERSSAARDAIKAAMGSLDEDEDEYDESDEEKRVYSRTRASRLKKPKSSASKSTDDSHSSDEDFHLSDDDGPQRKQAKRAGKQTKSTKIEEDEAWEDDLTEDEDAVRKAGDDDDEDYSGISEDEGEGNDMAVDEDEDYEDDLAPRKTKAKRKAKSNEASGVAKSKSVKATASSGGNLKVTMTGLTGTGTLVSQSNASRLASGGMSSGIKLKRGNQVLVDTAATLLNFGANSEAKAAAALATLVGSNELESSINFIAECGWILSSGSIQMTLLTILFTKLKDIAMRMSKPPSTANCDPNHDLESVVKVVSNDKSISRLMALLQLACSDFPILHADGLDNPTVVGTLAEKIVDTKILPNLVASSLASISTKPWTKKKVEPSSLNQIDRMISLLSATVIMTAYSERHATRVSNVEAIKASDDEIAIENEEKRFETIMAKSKRHQQASGDIAPNITRAILLAISGEDPDSEMEDQNLTKEGFNHPDAALSLVLFWSLTQAGSCNENVANSISTWVRNDSKLWNHPKTGVWLLFSYPSFIQEILFGFARTNASSPVVALRPTMIDRMLLGEGQTSSVLSNSNFGIVQLLSYLYLALSHGSISKVDAKLILSYISTPTERLREVPIFDGLSMALQRAIDVLSE